MNLETFRLDCWSTQVKNWGHIDRTIVEELALVTTEVAEAIEEVRDNHAPAYVYRNDDRDGEVEITATSPGVKPEGVGPELADVIIRVLNIATKYGIPIENHLKQKSEYNYYREVAHGGKAL